MTDLEKLAESGRCLARAFDLLERANEIHHPTDAAVVTKRGLLDEARRQVCLARDWMVN